MFDPTSQERDVGHPGLLPLLGNSRSFAALRMTIVIRCYFVVTLAVGEMVMFSPVSAFTVTWSRVRVA